MSDIDFTKQTIDQYRLVERLQKRPLTTLYLGHDTKKQNQPVFVELLNQPAAADEALADRFQRRLETVRQLAHPHIAPILQIGRDAPAANGKKGKTKTKSQPNNMYMPSLNICPALPWPAKLNNGAAATTGPTYPTCSR
jgi:hypothetical protein